MSLSNGIYPSELASEDWKCADENANKPASLIVQLRRRVVVLPWFRFVSAEGDNMAVDIGFASHAVRVTGTGLTALLVGHANQRVIRIMEPSENEAQFGVRGERAARCSGPAIHSITVHKFD